MFYVQSVSNNNVRNQLVQYLNILTYLKLNQGLMQVSHHKAKILYCNNDVIVKTLIHLNEENVFGGL